MGLKLCKTSASLLINQRKFILDILYVADLKTAKPAKTPFSTKLQLNKIDGDVLADSSFNRRLMGWLLYSTLTRPDISYHVQALS